MTCCKRCSRWLIAFISFCIIIWSVVYAILIYKRYKNKDWYKMLSINKVFVLIAIALALGLVSSIVGIFFFCGSPKCLCVTYLTLLLIVIFVEAVSIAFIIIYKNEIIDLIEKNWSKDKYKKTRINIEKEYRCCGFRNPEPLEDCGYKPQTEVDDLCYDKIKEDINKNKKEILIAAIVTGLVEVLLFICASYLICGCDDD